MPSLGPMVRSRWSELLGGSEALDSAFSLEGIADEVIFIAAPVLVVALVTEVQPVSGMLATVLLGVAGVAGLTRHRRSEPAVRTIERRSGSVLRSPGLRVLIGVQICLGALFAGRRSRDHRVRAGARGQRAGRTSARALRARQRDRRRLVRGAALASVAARQASGRPRGDRARRRAARGHAEHGRDGGRDSRGRPGYFSHAGQLVQHRGANRGRRPADRGHVLADHRRQHRDRDRVLNRGPAGGRARRDAPGTCSRSPPGSPPSRSSSSGTATLAGHEPGRRPASAASTQ